MRPDVDLYFISMAAELLGMHPQTLRKYERLGLIQPARTIGSMRLYAREELERLRLIKRLVDELGINLAGVQRLLAVAEVVQRIRSKQVQAPTYVILLTSRDSSADIVEGLRAGADDYVTKPANEDELIARVSVGARVVQLQTALADRVRSLEEALANVRALQTLLPMCAYCKKIRVDDKYWQQLEGYLTDHSDAEFSHGICPECFPSVMDEIRNEMS